MDFRKMNGDKSILLSCPFMDRKERKELKKLIRLSHKFKHKGKNYISIFFNGKQIRRSRAVIMVNFNCILPRDVHVHHINENKQDDRLNNLAILKEYDHLSLHSAGVRRKK